MKPQARAPLKPLDEALADLLAQAAPLAGTDTVNTFDHSGNYRSEYTSTETFCPVVALMNLTLTDVEYLTLRERQLPYTYTNEHGAELVITEAGEYRADWAEDDADNIALNDRFKLGAVKQSLYHPGKSEFLEL